MSLPSLIKNKIAKEIGYEAFIQRYVPIESINTESGEARFCCVAHAESTSSASFNISSGLWKCQSSKCGEAGDAIDFYYWATGCKTKGEAIHKLALELGVVKEITDAEVEQHHRYLVERPELLQRACQTFDLQPETLKQFKIGFVQPENQPFRYTIPIKGPQGDWEDIRLYNRQNKVKLRHWAEGHGAPRLFPYDHLQQETLFLFAGEKDAMRAWENGIAGALTITAAEGVVPHDLFPFKGKIVYVCYDIDEAGIVGSRKVATKLATVCKAVYLIRLPREGLPENGDYTDWCNAGHTAEEWAALVEEAEKIEPLSDHEPAHDPDMEPKEVTFRDLTDADLYGVPIRFLAHAMGKSHGLISYQVPTQVSIDCPLNQKRLCPKCSLFHMDRNAKPWSLPISYRSETSLQMFRCSEEQQHKAIRKLLSIHPKCEVVRINTSARQSVQHLLLSPAVELSQMRDDYNGLMPAYYHGEPISDNRDYWFIGYVHADPKTQQTVLNLHNAEPARNAIENFELNQDVFDALEWFKPDPGETIEQHLQKIHRVVEEDIGIWGRHNVQQAVLEAIFSVQKFRCGEREIENGWIETLVIGDSGSGKSTVAKRVLQLVNVGEMISGEMVSVAGLIGGIEFIDRIPVTKWGALPRNHGGIVVLDEIDEMAKQRKDITGQLTALRSSGVAEITKIHNARTPCRVRLVWLTNPVDGRLIASYNGACRAIEGVIENRQDVARFTKCYAVASDSVDVKTITQGRQRLIRDGVRRHFNNLAILTWSLTPEQVKFSDDAQEWLRRETERLTLKYNETIPLLERGRAYDKLAKLAVPVAVLSAAFIEDGETVRLQVELPHVQYAIRHLEGIYDGGEMGYGAFSEIETARSRIGNEKEVLKALQLVITVDQDALVRYLLTSSTLKRSHLEEFIGDRMTAAGVWSVLLSENCLQHVRSQDAAAKTRAFAELLERLLKDGAKGKPKRREVSIDIR